MRQFIAVVATALAIGGCSGTHVPGIGKPSQPKVDTSVSPLTGLHQDAPPKNSAFLVKIENTSHGEPQYGVNQADLVMEELVEGGVTRLAAVFYSKLPTKVGHVRSSRITDIYLAEPLDLPILASGGAPKTLRKIKKSGLPYYSYDMRSPGWGTDPSKSPPYHVLWDLTKLAKATKATVPPKSYFVFGKGPQVTSATKRVTHASVQFSPATTTTWTFAGGTWHRSPERAAAGQAYAAQTLAVIFVPVKDAGYRDPAGNAVPESVVQGSGRAVVFTGDAVTDGKWIKSGRNGQIRFASKSGTPMTIKPGHVWLEVVPRGGSITY